MRPKVCLFALIFFYANLNAQKIEQAAPEKINQVLLNSHWKAQWITHPSASLVDYGVFHFRKTFELEAKPHQFIINVSADNRYRLFVNGNIVCFGPERADLEHWHY
jgi:alpha-L-rhamnosidase